MQITYYCVTETQKKKAVYSETKKQFDYVKCIL